ncbi:MAG: hypothetical protein KDD22_08215 [Bdellovibrionales bacterium]|nr:hypothetical protein [Bdellovibrionales bacterium]
MRPLLIILFLGIAAGAQLVHAELGKSCTINPVFDITYGQCGSIDLDKVLSEYGSLIYIKADDHGFYSIGIDKTGPDNLGIAYNQIVISRHLNNGKRDLSFNSGLGLRVDLPNTYGFSQGARVPSVEVDRDGRLIFLARGFVGSGGITIIRVNRSGQIDETLQSRILYTPILESPKILVSEHSRQIYVVNGDFYDRDSYSVNSFHEDGSSNPNFGDHGTVKLDIERATRSWAHLDSLVLQNSNLLILDRSLKFPKKLARLTELNIQGKIVKAVEVDITHYFIGESSPKLILVPNGKLLVLSGDRDKFDVARYLQDGKLDVTFGDAGHIEVPKFTPYGLGEARVDPLGRIYIIADWHKNNYKARVIRFLENGAQDLSFNSGKELQIEEIAYRGTVLDFVGYFGSDYRPLVSFSGKYSVFK